MKNSIFILTTVLAEQPVIGPEELPEEQAELTELIGEEPDVTFEQIF